MGKVRFFNGNISRKSLWIRTKNLASLLLVYNGYSEKKIAACRKIKPSAC